jgi:sugar phosphate isomerase/epimerase
MNTYTRRQALAAAAFASCYRRLDAATLAQVRLGVTTDEIDEDVLTAARFLREFGVKFAEVRSIWGKYNTSATGRQSGGSAESAGWGGRQDLPSWGLPFFKIPLPQDTPEGRGILDSQWSLLDQSMERARILGTDKIRVFAFTYKEKSEKSNDKTYERIFELVREAARRAKVRNFRLALENVGGSYVSTGADAARLLKAVKEDALGLTWDPNNAGASGEKAFPDGFRLLDAARIIHVHLRDYAPGPDGKVEWRAVGQGEFDNLGQIRALLKTGYKENFTLETHYKSPQGKAHATRTSLTALLKVIEKV